MDMAAMGLAVHEGSIIMSNLMPAVRASVADAVLVEPDMSSVLVALQDRVGSQKYNAWFKHGTKLMLEDSIVKVFVPNTFVANWVESHYVQDIATVVREQLGLDVSVVVAIDHGLTGDLRKGQLDSQAQLVGLAAQGRTRTRPAETATLRHRLENFVVGESNRLAYTAALAVVAEKPPFNPLFIHGPCGVGKTHLLQGICQMAQRSTRGGRPMTWRYVTGEQFTNEFIQALRAKKIEEFRGRYRKLDLLAIDDVHFLSAKKATQDEFLHTFNAIETAGKTIVMASDAHPRLVGDMNEQLTSRFLAGMVVKVNAPDESMRLEIIKRRAADMKLQASPEALAYVAKHVRGSVRELEGALFKLSAIAALNGTAVTAAVAAEALSDHLARNDSAVTLGDIEATVSAYFGITQADLHSSRRTRTVSVARMITMYLARRHTRMSFPEIGQAMGKNHSSVVLACQRLEHLLASGEPLEWLSPMGIKTMAAQQVVDLLTEQIK